MPPKKGFKQIKTKEQFIERANEKHQGFYSYELVEFPERGVGLTYQGIPNRTLSRYYREAEIIIICPKHGPFTQRARKHLEGSGCRSCGLEIRSNVRVSKAKINCHLRNNNFKQFDNHVEIYTTPSDGIERTILLSKEDKDVMSFAKWYSTGHQESAHGRTNYCVSRRTERLVMEGYEWLGTGPKMHRLIMSRIIGRTLKRNEIVDHINQNGLDNRRENLRIVTHSQNKANQRKMRSRGGKPTSSQYKGVCHINNPGHAYDGKWSSTVAFQRKRYRLGVFDNEVDAAKAYDVKARELHGEYAYLNFPNE